VATLAVGAIQAPAAGMIGASTGALALYALPALRRHGYRNADAAGLVAAAGSLGAVAPPESCFSSLPTPSASRCRRLFLAMLAPLAVLLALYLAFALARGSQSRGEDTAPAGLGGALLTAALMVGLVALVVLGLATLSEAAALAAAGAVLAALVHGRLTWRVLDAAIRQTALLNAMVFFIFVGANVFSWVFRLLGGAEMVAAGASALGSGGYAPLAAALLLVFALGLFLDWLEIVVIALPVLATALVAAGVGRDLGNAQLAGCWIGAMFAIALQTSFLTPPFGYALFLVHGATRGECPWRGLARRHSVCRPAAPRPARRRPRCRISRPGFRRSCSTSRFRKDRSSTSDFYCFGFMPRSFRRIGELLHLLVDRGGELGGVARGVELGGRREALCDQRILRHRLDVGADPVARRVRQVARARRDDADQPLEVEPREAGVRPPSAGRARARDCAPAPRAA
jgi:TRAP-type C4-dicarboxylate transport system permease large subunit